MRVKGLVFHLTHPLYLRPKIDKGRSVIALCSLDYDEYTNNANHRIVHSFKSIPTHATCTACALIAFSNKKSLRK